MAVERPTLQEVIDRIEADMKVKTIYPLVRRSVLKVLARIYGGAVHTLYGFLEYKGWQTFVNFADAAHLDRHAEEYGMSRQVAKKSEGLLLMRGVLNTTIPAGTELQSPDGLLYEVREDSILDGATGAPSPSGQKLVVVDAKEAGIEYNQAFGTVFTFTSPLTDVFPTATALLWMRGGTDRETDDELRARVLRRKQYPPRGGSKHDYVTWMLEVPGVTRAWAFPEIDGHGTIGCAFVMDGEAPTMGLDILSREVVKKYITEHEDPITGLTVGCPVGALPGLRMMTLTLLPVHFEIILTPNTTVVQGEVKAELEDLIIREGGPGETIKRSRISEVISTTYGETSHTLIVPAADVVASNIQLHVMGSVTFQGEV